MTIGERISILRKSKNWSQAELARKASVSRVIISKYERNEANPSIDIAKKIAAIFEVTLDYLAGEGQNSSFDKKTLNRIEAILQMDNLTKNSLFSIIDAVVRDFKAKETYSI
jgi:transcriptional regulator with XRE-family HTH domain